MNHGLLRTLGMIEFGLLALTVSSVSAQTTANGPYYATPSWDQTLPASTRFIVLSNFNSQAVLDRETGLVWERDPVTAHPTAVSEIWLNATAICRQVWTGGRAGWRLPALNELASLFDPSVTTGVALPTGHPFLNIVEGSYWTATTEVGGPTTASYAVSFAALSNTFVLERDQSSRIWCVRGGGPLDQY
jgi:hypothetical protein